MYCSPLFSAACKLWGQSSQCSDSGETETSPQVKHSPVKPELWMHCPVHSSVSISKDVPQFGVWGPPICSALGCRRRKAWKGLPNTAHFSTSFTGIPFQFYNSLGAVAFQPVSRVLTEVFFSIFCYLHFSVEEEGVVTSWSTILLTPGHYNAFSGDLFLVILFSQSLIYSQLQLIQANIKFILGILRTQSGER